jgi:hypothetical protein
MRPRHRIALVTDPRFAGGTSSAVAREIFALSSTMDLRLAYIETAMFKTGEGVNVRLAQATDACGIQPVWNPPIIAAETVVFHNLSALKFNMTFAPRINCRRLVVVAHENFLRPNGDLSFDIAKSLGLLAGRTIAEELVIAPVSVANRRTIEAWLSVNPCGNWSIAPINWFNICDFDLVPPTPKPRDRRGRVSRPGFEKFADLPTMLTHFPPHAERCAILGADSFLLPGATPPSHWELLPFGSVEVRDFLTSIDFFIYFTHPNLRESFGRVLAEAVAAGKVVITDPDTAETFGESVVASDGSDVDSIVAGFIVDPDRYRSFVVAAQARLADFGADEFRRKVTVYLHHNYPMGIVA